MAHGGGEVAVVADGVRRTGIEPGHDLLGSHVGSQQGHGKRGQHRGALACERSIELSAAADLFT